MHTFLTTLQRLSCVIGSHRLQAQHIAAQASQKFNMCDFVASTQTFIAKAEIACSGVHPLRDIELTTMKTNLYPKHGKSQRCLLVVRLHQLSTNLAHLTSFAKVSVLKYL